MIMRKDFYNEVLNANHSQDDFRAMDGYPIGNPTVKEFIGILRKFPADYRITCCGGENFLYLFPDNGYITIDNESYLCV